MCASTAKGKGEYEYITASTTKLGKSLLTSYIVVVANFQAKCKTSNSEESVLGA